MANEHSAADRARYRGERRRVADQKILIGVVLGVLGFLVAAVGQPVGVLVSFVGAILALWGVIGRLVNPPLGRGKR